MDKKPQPGWPAQAWLGFFVVRQAGIWPAGASNFPSDQRFAGTSQAIFCASSLIRSAQTAGKRITKNSRLVQIPERFPPQSSFVRLIRGTYDTSMMPVVAIETLID
jgi:hypothetical protein